MNLSFTAEQQAALDELVQEYNLAAETELTQDEYLETVIYGLVNDKVSQNFNKSVEDLVALAKNAPYELRMEAISTVQDLLS